jgi:vesicle transport through interaction with t-SNAREs protein 1
MEVEARTLDSKTKSKCMQILAQFRSDLDTQKKDFERIQNDVNRDTLFSVSEGASADQRARLLNTSQREARGTQQLEDARRQLVDVEQEGTGVMNDLRRQRDVILKVGDNVR